AGLLPCAAATPLPVASMARTAGRLLQRLRVMTLPPEDCGETPSVWTCADAEVARHRSSGGIRFHEDGEVTRLDRRDARVGRYEPSVVTPNAGSTCDVWSHARRSRCAARRHVTNWAASAAATMATARSGIVTTPATPHPTVPAAIIT